MPELWGTSHAANNSIRISNINNG